MGLHLSKYKIFYIIALLLLLVAYYNCLPSVLFGDPYCKVMYDKDDDLMGATISKDGQWRFPLIDSVPSKFEKCILTFEDRRYYYHPGFDPIAIFGATIQNIKAGTVVRGGSTITMQVMRLASKGNARTFINKLVETIQATRLEFKKPKAEILRLYASHAPFGGNVVGLESASWRYYYKSPHLLSWSESATLAVLPNAPSLIHLGKNRDALQKKRNRLLHQLLVDQTIDSTTYRLALLEPIPDKPVALPKEAPHLLHRTDLFKHSSQLHTSIDPDIQKTVNEVVDFYHSQYQNQNIENLAALVLDTYTGQTLAYVGNAPNSRNEQDVDMVMAKRSTGSVLKPFLYANAIKEGLITNKSLLDDVPIYIDGFHPENYDRNYRGVIPADQALMQSLNVPFVLLLREFGISKFINALRSLGMQTIDKGADYYGLSLIIGGAEGTLWQMCGAYATYGRILTDYIKYQARYERNLTFNPSLINLSSETSIKETVVDPILINAGSIYHTLEALTELKRPSEEGDWEQFSSARKIAWKTGTSFGHKDAWAIGVTPRYTIGVWVGNADGEGIAELVGVKKAAPVLFDIFNRLPDGDWFDVPYDDLLPVPMCRLSGMTASDNCTAIDTSYLSTTSLNKRCVYHKTIHLDQENKHQVNSSCYNINDIVTSSWFVLSPKQAEYYRKINPEYSTLPPFAEGCLNDERTLVDIIYPPHNGEIIIPKNLNNGFEKIIVKAVHSKQNGKVFWYLDNEFLGATIEFHTMALSPAAGKHTLTVSDENGAQVTRRFEVQ